MKLLIAFAVLIACAVAAPQDKPVVETVKFVNDIHENGYNFLYETSDGQKRDETATFEEAPPTEENPNNTALKIVGSYEFTTPEGKTYRVDYTSGVNGFLPKISIVN